MGIAPILEGCRVRSVRYYSIPAMRRLRRLRMSDEDQGNSTYVLIPVRFDDICDFQGEPVL